MKPLSDEQYQQLTHLIYRDLTIDTLGNLALGFGLYLVFSDHATYVAIMDTIARDKSAVNLYRHYQFTIYF